MFAFQAPTVGARTRFSNFAIWGMLGYCPSSLRISRGLFSDRVFFLQVRQQPGAFAFIQVAQGRVGRRRGRLQQVPAKADAAGDAIEPDIRAEHFVIAGGVGRLSVGHLEVQLQVIAIQ